MAEGYECCLSYWGTGHLRAISQAWESDSPALPFALQEEKVEEGPREDIFTVEPVPHLYRESHARRSSYAFSHHEGYADLITQGTILRTGPGVNNDIASDSPVPCEEEASLSPKESHWHLRKVSSMGKKCQQQGRVSSEETQSPSTISSLFSMDSLSTFHSENQPALLKNLLASTNRLSGSFQEQLPRVQERPLSPKQRPPSPEKLPLTKERYILFRRNHRCSEEASCHLPRAGHNLWRASHCFQAS